MKERLWEPAILVHPAGVCVLYAGRGVHPYLELEEVHRIGHCSKSIVICRGYQSSTKDPGLLRVLKKLRSVTRNYRVEPKIKWQSPDRHPEAL